MGLPEAAQNERWGEINESRGLKIDPRFESGNVFSYRGYLVSLIEKPAVNDEGAKLFAWAGRDERIVPDTRNGRKWFFNIVESIPKKFWIPILEHEIYELEEITVRDRSREDAHREAIDIGRKRAEELGILDDFLRFEEECNKK